MCKESALEWHPAHSKAKGVIFNLFSFKQFLHWQKSISFHYFGLKGANRQRHFDDKYLRPACAHFSTEQRAVGWFSVHSADVQDKVQYLNLCHVPRGVTHRPFTLPGSCCRRSHRSMVRF